MFAWLCTSPEDMAAGAKNILTTLNCTELLDEQERPSHGEQEAPPHSKVGSCDAWTKNLFSCLLRFASRLQAASIISLTRNTLPRLCVLTMLRQTKMERKPKAASPAAISRTRLAAISAREPRIVEGRAGCPRAVLGRKTQTPSKA
jgi:hypothetical protein